MPKKSVLEELKKPLIEFIEKNLPVSYSRIEADGGWEIKITKNGNMKLGGYAEDFVEVEDWRELPLSELAYLAESKF